MNSNVTINDFDNADTLSIDTLALFDDLEHERTKEISELSKLSKKVSFLHTKLLHYGNSDTELGIACHNAWKNIVKCVEGSSEAWRELGYHLGVSKDDLDYIKHSVKFDPTDTVLKLFMQDDDATLDKVLDAFVKMHRYDILKKIEDPICEMAVSFNKDEEKSDTGYYSNSTAGDSRKIITLKTLNIDLPPTLKKNILGERKPNQPFKSPKITESQTNSTIKNDIPILFLTFAEDGIETALNIQDMVNDWFDLQVEVITLEERKEDVMQNPDKFIREYFEKADYIVPLITPGYLEQISSYDACLPLNTSENLDCKYTKFIYNLISNQYMHVTGCLNKNVRSVLPEKVNLSILASISMYAALMPWTHETSFNEQFREFLLNKAAK